MLEEEYRQKTENPIIPHNFFTEENITRKLARIELLL
jgi:hypothetical protein